MKKQNINIVLLCSDARGTKPHISAILLKYTKNQNAGLAELVDALDLGSSIARCESSSLLTRTILIFQLLNTKNTTQSKHMAELVDALLMLELF